MDDFSKYQEELSLFVVPSGDKPNISTIRGRVKQVVKKVWDDASSRNPSISEINAHRDKMIQEINKESRSLSTLREVAIKESKEATKLRNLAEENLYKVQEFLEATRAWVQWIKGEAPLEQHQDRWERLMKATEKLE